MSDKENDSKEVWLTGINIPFFHMVELTIKWTVASIPAILLLCAVGYVVIDLFMKYIK